MCVCVCVCGVCVCVCVCVRERERIKIVFQENVQNLQYLDTYVNVGVCVS